jgi:hypothetical protein
MASGGFHGVIPRVQDKVVHVTFSSSSGEHLDNHILLEFLARTALPPAAGRGGDLPVAAPDVPL